MAQVTFDTHITFDDFAKVDIRVGRIVQVEFGELGVKTSSAQIMKQIADFFSEVLTLGVLLGEVDVVLSNQTATSPWAAGSRETEPI